MAGGGDVGGGAGIGAGAGTGRILGAGAQLVTRRAIRPSTMTATASPPRNRSAS